MNTLQYSGPDKKAKSDLWVALTVAVLGAALPFVQFVLILILPLYGNSLALTVCVMTVLGLLSLCLYAWKRGRDRRSTSGRRLLQIMMWYGIFMATIASTETAVLLPYRFESAARELGHMTQRTAEDKCRLIAKACQRYCDAHGNKLPESLKQLSDESLLDSSAFLVDSRTRIESHQERNLETIGDFTYLGAGVAPEDAYSLVLVCSSRPYLGKYVMCGLDLQVSIVTPDELRDHMVFTNSVRKKAGLPEVVLPTP